MRVLVMGSLNYDFVYEVDHIHRPGETIESLSMGTYYGGKGLNQAIALSKAGAPVYMSGLVGEDGKDLRNCCKEYGIDTAYLKTVKGKKGRAVMLLYRLIKTAKTAYCFMAAQTDLRGKST